MGTLESGMLPDAIQRRANWLCCTDTLRNGISRSNFRDRIQAVAPSLRFAALGCRPRIVKLATDRHRGALPDSGRHCGAIAGH